MLLESLLMLVTDKSTSDFYLNHLDVLIICVTDFKANVFLLSSGWEAMLLHLVV